MTPRWRPRRWGGVGGLTYTLPLPAPTPPGVTITKSDGTAADGQHGTSRTAVPGVSGETTTINGIPIAGPGSAYNDSDFNGGDTGPLPSLWDTTGHEINFPSGTPALMVANASAGGALPTDSHHRSGERGPLLPVGSERPLFLRGGAPPPRRRRILRPQT